jgi:eukaryotic-like serine/threonine-protein kinase
VLERGTRLGAYTIDSAIGAGGMGEVYRATDTQLKRSVAIKILPPAVAVDVERVARFQREAEVLASLNHPNIAGIYGLERTAETIALVMELVEGPTLADRIERGAVPLDEALPIARQIAQALEAAHEQGIVHRDLKPANIKLRSDGAIKVLDFGLAKAVGVGDRVREVRLQPDLTASPTITTPAMTQAGMILGSAAYMSPEQARGKPVDRRADVWAFGAVLYEMLTGARAFQGEDVGEVLASVVKSDVDWSLLPADTPASVRTLLGRCLRKDSKQRLADAGAARLEIDDAIAAPSSAPAARVPLWQRAVFARVPILITIVAIALAAAIATSLRRPAPTPPPASSYARLALALPRGSELTDFPVVAISPDGAYVAYVASRGSVPELFLRPLNALDARTVVRMADAPALARAAAPFFSRDSQWLVFFSDGKLIKVSTTGGVMVPLAESPGGGGGTWGPDGSIVYTGPGRGLFQVSSAGGAPHPVWVPDQNSGDVLRYPEFLPGGDALLVTSNPRGTTSPDDSTIEILKIKTGERKALIQGGYAARYLPTGHLVYQRSGTMVAVGFDPGALQLKGTPVPVVEGVRQPFTGVGAFSCSESGTCAYVAGATLSQRTATLVDRSGVSRPLPLPPRSYSHPRFSPAGDKLVFWMNAVRCDLEIYDIARGSMTRLTSEGDNHSPIWTPDGLHVTYISNQPGVGGGRYDVYSKPANATRTAELLSKASQQLSATTPLAWSPDGSMLAFADRGDLWLLPKSGEPRPFMQTRFAETTPAFSPDGRWLAYASDESGRFEVYVQPFPQPGEKYSVSIDGGADPVWAKNGRELFFRNADRLMVVDVSSKSGFTATRPKVLFSGDYVRRSGWSDYDISPDGEHFIMINPGEQERPATEITVLLNWFDELKRRVPSR